MEKNRDKKFDRLRQKAEELLNGNTLTDKTDEISNLIQELQIYQMELEIQNQELIKTTEQLENSRDRLSFLYHRAPVGYATLDDSGMIKECNERFSEILNMPSNKILFKPFSKFIHEEDKNIYFARIKAFLNNPENKFIEIRLKRNNTYFYSKIEGRYVPWEKEDHTKLRDNMLITITDISKQKELEENLRIAKRMETASTMAGGISHEFNNILSIILGNIELVLLNFSQDTETKYQLSEIKKACLRAKDIVGQILKFTEFMGHKSHHCDAGELLKKAFEKIKLRAGKNIETKYFIAKGDLSIIGDKNQIQTALQNILENSIYSLNEKKGGITGKVKNFCIDEENAAPYYNILPGKYIKIEINDSGTGIKEKDKEKIFDPFFSTKPFGEGQGTGLSIVHGIIKNHGGFIDVKSEENKGTSFSIYLPQNN